MGKSRLLRELCERIEAEPHTELFHQCSPYHVDAALHPVIEQLERAAGFEPDDDVATRLDKMESVVAGPDGTRALFAALLSIETERYGPLGLAPGKQKELTLHALASRLAELAGKSPVLLLVEDAHWIDPTTKEAFDLQFSALAAMPVLAVVTFRPEYAPPWSTLAHATPLRLARLGGRHARAMVERLGAELPEEVRSRIVAQTDGVPLFVEELTSALGTAHSVGAADGGLDGDPAGSPPAIPSTLQESLTARLDRLGRFKEVAQVAACIGRHFTPAMLAAARGVTEAELADSLAALVDSGLVHQDRSRDGSGLAFKHFLVQQAAYAGLLKSSRRQIHARIAAWLIARHDRDQGADPIAIAQHLRAADRIGDALPWLRRAAERAANSGSMQESMEIVNRALRLVGELQGAREDRERAEFDLLMAKLPVCVALEGWASEEGNRVCSRALDLAVSLGDKARESSVLYQIATMHEVRGEYSETQEVLARRSALLGRAPAAEPMVESGELMACSTFYQGRFDVSIEHATQALRHVDPRNSTALGTTVSEDPTIACLFWIAKSLLLQGHVDEARARHREAIEYARRSTSWYAESHAAIDAALFGAYQRDFELALDNAKRAIGLSARVGLAYREAVAVLIDEWAGAEAFGRSPDRDKLGASLDLFRRAGAMIGHGFYLSLAVEAFARLGDLARCAELMDEALRACATSRGFFYESELHRLAGRLREARGGAGSQSEAENCYQGAIRMAGARGARLLELRAANSLARSWLDRGRAAEARNLLGPLRDRFGEGVVAVDLVEARALLARAGP